MLFTGSLTRERDALKKEHLKKPYLFMGQILSPGKRMDSVLTQAKLFIHQELQVLGLENSAHLPAVC